MRQATGSPQDAARPTFVLGTGAQKAGTTWLSRYLQTSPEFDRGYRKEYHVFDCLDLPSEAWLQRNVVDLARTSIEGYAAGVEPDNGPAAARHVHRLSMLMDPELYFDFFASLVHRDDEVRATGDLTPEYALLSAQRMVSIRESFAERGLRTVAVFLMRDPVDRVWSQLRMRAHQDPEHHSGSIEQSLLTDHALERFAVRTRYHETLAALGEAFVPEQVHVGLYETLFAGEDDVLAISELVGITPRRPRLARKANSSPRAVAELPDEIARPVAEHYAETYREVARLRPDLDLERWWPRSRWVL